MLNAICSILIIAGFSFILLGRKNVAKVAGDSLVFVEILRLVSSLKILLTLIC